MTDLWTFALGDVEWGDGTDIVNTGWSISEPASTNADQAMPGEDGMMMGRDYLQGRTISWDLTIDRETATAGRALWQALESAWDARDVRLTPGAVTSVSLQGPDGVAVLAYGRPRKIAPSTMNFLHNGRVDVVADFATADRLFYDAAEQEVSTGIQPTVGVGGGITWPITWPITWATPDTSNLDVVVNAGTAPTWPVIIFEGPVVNPAIVLGDNDNTVQLVTTLAENQTVTIDTRPWSRSVLRDDGGSLAGVLRGSRLAELALPPGQTTVSMQGVDLDGTATGRVRWRNAYMTP